jgi:hypothetical protein
MGSTKLQSRSAKMSPRTPNQIAKSREQALAAFLSKKAEIDAMLTRLQALSDDHFGYAPDDVTWGHVGTLGNYAELLKRVTDSAFKGGRACPVTPPPARRSVA